MWKSLERTTWSCLAIAVLFLSLTSNMAFAAVAPVKPSAAEVHAFREAFGVGASQAEASLGRQERGVAIVGKLKNVLGADYAGVWFDPSSGEFVIPIATAEKGGVVSESRKTAVAQQMATASLAPGDYRTEIVRFSWGELEAAQLQINQKLDVLFGQGLVQTALDPGADAVVVRVPESTGTVTAATVESLVGNPAVKMEIRTAPDAVFEAGPAGCNEAMRKCDLPMRGGVYIYGGPFSGNLYKICTAAFRANGSDGKKYILTAGHCAIEEQGNPVWSWITQDPAGTSHSIGTMSQWHWPGRDWAKIDATGSWADTPPWSTMLAYWGAEYEYPVYGEAASYKGETLCHIGANTGSTCGIVKALNVSVTYSEGNKLNSMTEVGGSGLCLAGGDSGGPVIASNYALGITSGGYSACGGAILYYSEVTAATAELGVNIAGPGAPEAITGAATEVQPYQATVHGEVNANQVQTTYGFEYGKTGYTSSTAEGDGGAGQGWSSTYATLRGLDPGSTYEYRIKATNALNTAYGAEGTFTTPPAPPKVEAGGAVNIRVEGGTGKATFRGAVNPQGALTHYRIEWGSTESYGNKVPVPDGEVGAGLEWKPLEQQISGLKGSRTYYYRLVAENAAGTGEAKGAFDTPDWSPSVTTEAPAAIGTYEAGGSNYASKAALHGLVNPNGFDTHYHFEYGTAQGKLKESIPLVPPDLGSGQANVAVAQALEGLQSSATYYFRVSAESEEGTKYGKEASFTTPEWALLSPAEPGEAAKGSMADAACVGEAECYAVGSYTDASGTVLPLAGERTGGSWSVLSAPAPAGAKSGVLEGIACGSASDCVAAGSYVTSGGATMPLAERWNGTSWSIQSTPAPAGATAAQLKDVSCSSTSACTAVGYYTSSAGASLPLAERWNGSAWSLQTVAAPGGFPNGFLLGVSCSGGSECWAVGEATFSKGESGSPRGFAERWNGSEWKTPVLPGTASRLTAVACPSSGFCAAVGSGLDVERYDGSSWFEQAAAGIGGEGVLNAITCPNVVACAAVGSYTVGAHTAPFGERWDGSGWSVATMTDPVSLVEGTTGAVLRGVSCASSSACTTVGYRSGFKVQRVLAEAHRPGPAPTAVTEPATGTAAPEAVLNAVVNPNGEDTTYHFEYDTTEYKNGEPPHGTSVPVPAKDIGSGIGEVRIAERVSGLVNKQTYHFRVVAESAKGTTYGGDQSFTMHAWSLQATSNPPPRTEDTIESTSCPGATVCVAVGYDGFSHESFAEAWNGAEWRVVGSVEGTMKRISCPATNWCAAIGYSAGGGLQYWRFTESAGTWSVKAFSSLPLPAGASFSAVRGLSCSSSTACTAVGSYYNGAEYKPLVDRWNGSAWSTQSAPNPAEGSAQNAMLAVSCPSATLCTAVGEAAKKPYAERWNGSEWVQQTIPAPAGATESTLEAVSCTAEACMAVGHLLEGGKDKPLAERWNGKSWSLAAAPMPAEAPGGADLYSVSCPTSSSCLAVGRRINKEEERKGVFVPLEERTLAESWNGSEWTVQATPNPEAAAFSLLDTVSCTAASACTAMGATYPGALGQESLTVGERFE
jgi:hypothetical protein